MAKGSENFTILGIAGSLRKDSYNKAILRAVVSLVPEKVTLNVFDKLGEIPPFNQDDEENPPEVVADLKDNIREADAILFATPEYNYSIPGVLKNAIDWASRPYGDSAWEGKPVGIMSAASGMQGGSRAQYHLRQVFVFLDMHPLNRPEVIIPTVQQKINEKGELTDKHTKDKITELIADLVKWSIELKTGEALLKEAMEAEDYDKAYGRMMS